MYFLYSALAAVAVVLSSPYWLLRMLRHSKYRAGLAERLGRVPDRLHEPQQRSTIWVHAVSVGEVLAVSGLISELQQRLPSHRIVISTTTATGQELARDRFGEVNVFYFPLDFAFAVGPYLRALRPKIVVVAETEFWPNFLRLARRLGARIAVVNARISDRSFPRYSKFRVVIAPVLRNVDIFLAQSDEDARRLVKIGAPEERVRVSGNLKFDLNPAVESPLVAQLKSALVECGPVLVCGSTVEGEELIVLSAFAAVRRQYPEAFLILAPRHPERFAQVAEIVAASGMNYWRRSQWTGQLSAGILLLDTIGELAATYALADIAFVGGSLVPRGGHNILEAAPHGTAIVVGPYMENFRDILTLFVKANAVVISNADQLATTFLKLLADDTRRRDLGSRAREILGANTGATARTVAALQSLLVERAAPAAAAKVSPRVGT